MWYPGWCLLVLQKSTQMSLLLESPFRPSWRRSSACKILSSTVTCTSPRKHSSSFAAAADLIVLLTCSKRVGTMFIKLIILYPGHRKTFRWVGEKRESNTVYGMGSGPAKRPLVSLAASSCLHSSMTECSAGQVRSIIIYLPTVQPFWRAFKGLWNVVYVNCNQFS